MLDLTEGEEFSEVFIRSHQSPQDHWLSELLHCVNLLWELGGEEVRQDYVHRFVQYTRVM